MRLLVLRIKNVYMGAQIDLYYWALTHNRWWLMAVAIKWMATNTRDIGKMPKFRQIESMFRSAYQPVAQPRS